MNGETTDDVTAINAVLSGDKAQYRVVVERYHRGLINYLYNMTRDSTIAEDLAQDAFLQAFRKLSTYNSAYSFSTWLYAIASNIAKDHFKKNSRILRVVPDGRASELSPDEAFTQSARAQNVRDAIATLKPDYQQVINLFYWENKSYEEIATIVGCPIGTARTWLSRGKQQLEEQLYGQF